MTELPHDPTAPDETSTWWLRRAHWVYASIRTGGLTDWDGPTQTAQHEIRMTTLGSMTFPDGELVLGDPYLLDEVPAPITRRLSTGPHDVVIATATVGPGHDRIAAALLVRSPAPVARWTMAHLPTQEPRSLTDHEFFGYAVDAGTGCFAGLAAAEATAAVMHEDAGMLEDPLSRGLLADGSAPGATLVSPAAGVDPVAAFSSGWGDGYYPTWIGLDAHDEVVVVVTDFLLTNEPFAPRPPEPQPTRKPARGWRALFSRRRA